MHRTTGGSQQGVSLWPQVVDGSKADDPGRPRARHGHRGHGFGLRPGQGWQPKRVGVMLLAGKLIAACIVHKRCCQRVGKYAAALAAANNFEVLLVHPPIRHGDFLSMRFKAWATPKNAT
jgi:hypothetical protein